jgi:hypothetical protein
MSGRVVNKFEKLSSQFSLAILGTFCFFKKKLRKLPTLGAGGGAQFFSLTQNLIFCCELKPHAKFRNPTITPSGRKVTLEERRRRRKNAVNSGHLVL